MDVVVLYRNVRCPFMKPFKMTLEPCRYTYMLRNQESPRRKLSNSSDLLHLSLFRPLLLFELRLNDTKKRKIKGKVPQPLQYRLEAVRETRGQQK